MAAVLSGNRNFEGRINALVKANYLASPPLVVAYALAGRIDIDLTSEPLGEDSAGKPVYLRDIWPSDEEVRSTVRASIRSEMFQHEYEKAFEGDANWNSLPVPTGDIYVWDAQSTYIKRPPYFDDMVDPETRYPGFAWHARAGAAGRFDHHRPHFAGRIDRQDSSGGPISDRAGRAAEGLQLLRRAARQPRSDGARHAGQRAPAQSACARYGRRMDHAPAGRRADVHLRRLDALSEGRRAAGDHRGQGVRLRVVARLGGEGRAAAWA